MKKFKYFFLLILISLLIISCSKHKSPTATTIENTRIKKYIFYDTSNNLFATQILDYDSQNRLYKFSEYDANNNINKYYIYEYNANDLIIKASEYDNSSTLKRYMIYQYDANGNTVSAVDYFTGDTTPAYVYNYEYVNGKLYKIIWLLNGTEPVHEFIYSYDVYGNIIKCEHYDTIYNPPTLSGYETVEYDSKNKMVKCSYYDGLGNVKAYFNYFYDENDNIIKTEYYLDNSLYYVCIWEYEIF